MRPLSNIELETCHDITMSEKKSPFISHDDRKGLEETLYLLRSPNNAERLLAALARSRRNEGAAQNVGDLKSEVDLSE